MQLAATETLAPAEAHMGPTEAQQAATESLASAEGSKSPQECSRRTKQPQHQRDQPKGCGAGQQHQEHPRNQPKGYGKRQRQEPEEPKEPEEPEEPEEDPGWDEWPPDGNNGPLPFREDRSRRCGAENAAEEDAVTALLEEEARENCKPEPRRIVLTPENISAREKSTRAIHEKQAVMEELRGMRRAREGGTAAEADTVGVRRDAVRFAEDAKMDRQLPDETLVHRENQEGIRIRRSPGDYAKHLPWVLERVFLQTLCGPGNDEQGRCASSDVRGNSGRRVSGSEPGSRDQCVRSKARGDRGRCASSDVPGSGDPGGGPEPEADYKPPSGKLPGVMDEIQVLNRPKEARMPEPVIMRAREVPGEETTMATAASVGEQVQKTARLFNPHGSPPIMWEGGEDESALKDIRKQFAAQWVPAQLRSSFQPEPRREASSAERPKEPIPGKVSGQPTIKTRESIMLADGELCGDREDAMRDSRRAAPPDETAAGVRPMPSMNAVRGRRRTGQAAEVAEALIPSPAGEDPPAARNGRPTTSGMSAGATAATAGKDGPVAPLPGEPTSMKAEARVPHPADLLALQVPSQWILEAAAATSRDQAQGTAGSVAQCELQPSGKEESGDEPPLGGPWRGTDETGQQGRHARPCEANQSSQERKATSAAHPDELKPGTNPAAVATMQRQEEAGREAGAEKPPERGSPMGVQQMLHQEETGREAGAENFPERGTLWSLKTDAGGEMRRPIIEAAVEEARGKRDGNGEENQEKCGNGDKRPAGIAAPREEWEDFVGAVEDKGDEGDPQNATRNQAGHPVPAGHGSCQHRR